MNIAELVAELGLDASQYQAGLAQAEAMARVSVQNIEQQFKNAKFTHPSLVVTVDDRALTELNKHLDKKVAHRKAVQADFDRNPITPKVDDRALTVLNKRIDEVRANVKALKSDMAGLKMPSPINASYSQPRRDAPRSVQDSPAKVEQRQSESNRRLEVAIEKSLNKLGDRVVGAVLNTGKQSLGQRIGSIVTAPIKAVGSVVSNIAVGSLEGMGRELTKDLSKGISQGLKEELSYSIGSFENIGDSIGKSIVKGITQTLGRDADLIENILSDLIGKDVITQQGAAVRGAGSAKRRKSQNLASAQISDEFDFVQNNIDEILGKGQKAKLDRQTLGKAEQQLNEKIADYGNKLGKNILEAQLKSLNNDIDDISSKLSIATDESEISTLSAQSKALVQRRSNLSASIEGVIQRARSQFQKALDELQDADDELLVRERELSRYGRAFELGMNGGAQPVKVQRTPRKAPIVSQPMSRDVAVASNPESYNAIAREVAKASGVSMTNSQIPRLVQGDTGEFSALYNPDKNEIKVPPAFYEGIKAQALTAKQFELVVHELRHSVQLGFGRAKIEQGAVPGVDILSPSKAEALRLGQQIELSTGKNPSAAVRELEQDAYVFADRFAKSINEKLSQIKAVESFTNTVGIGGGKVQNQVMKARNLAALKGQKSLDAGEISQEQFDEAASQIDKIYAGFSKDLEKLLDVDLLPADEIKGASAKINARMNESVMALINLAQNIKNIVATVEVPKEAVLVEANNQQAQRAKESRIGSNSFASKAKTRLNQQVYSMADDPWDDELEKVAKVSRQDVEASIEQAKELSGKFQNLYSYFKQLVKEGDIAAVTALQSDIARYASEAQGTIDAAISQAKQLEAPDNTLVNQLGAEKGRIGAKVKYSQQAVLKMQRLQGDESLAGVGEIAGSVSEYLKQVQASVKGRLNAANAEAEVQRAIRVDQIAAGVSPGQVGYQKDMDASQRQADRANDGLNKSLEKLTGGNESLGDRVQRIFKANGGLDKYSGQVGMLTDKFSGLFNTVSQLALFTAGLNLFGDFAAQAIEAAAALESLESKLKFATGSAAAGSELIASTRENAKRFGTDFNVDIQGAAGLQASARGTSMQGYEAEALAASFQQASSAYQLSTEEAERAYTALTQIMSKGKLSAEEIRGQMAESLPGAFQIAARSMNVTTSELDKMLMNGEVLSSEFLPKFARQLEAETFIGANDAATTYTASLNRMNSQFLELQQGFGKPLMDVKKMGLDQFNNVLKLAASNMEAMSIIVLTLAASLAVGLGSALISTLSALKVLPVALAVAKAGLAGFTAALTPTLLIMAALTAAYVAYQVAVQATGDASGEAGKQAEMASPGFEKLKKQLDGVKESADAVSKSLQAEGMIGKLFNKQESPVLPLTKDKFRLPGTQDSNPINRVMNFDLLSPFQGISQRVVNQQVERQNQGRRSAADALTAQSNEKMGAIRGIISGGAGSQDLAQYKELEVQLKAVRLEQQATAAIAPENLALLSQLKDRERQLLDQQTEIAPTISQSVAEIEKEIQRQTEALKGLESDFENKIIDEKAFNASSKLIKNNLTELTRLQEDFNAAIKDGSTAYAQFARASEDIRALNTDQNTQLLQGEAAARADLLRQPLTSAQRESGIQALSETRLMAQQQANEQAIAAIKQQLQRQEISSVLQQVGATPDSAIGAAQLDLLRSRSGESVEIQTAVGLMENLRDLEAQASQLGEESAQIAADITTRMTEADKALNQYFREIKSQVESLAIDTKRAQQELKMTRVQSDINKAIDGVTGSFVDGLGELLIELINSFNAITMAALDRDAANLDALDQQMQALLGNDQQRMGLAGGYGAAMLGAGGGGMGGGGAFRSGLFTGPAANIGGSSAYHIDTKLSKDLSMQEQVALFDQMAAGYAALGKEIEFSNSAVSGEIYNLNASFEEKAKLLERAAAAHSHNLHAAYDSFDYYIPDAGKGRRDSSTEGAEMLLPTVPGGRIEYGSGGGYGNYATITDASGNVVLKTGHGDNRRAVPTDRALQAQAQARSSGGGGGSRGGLNLGSGYESLSSLGNQLMQNQYFNPTSPEAAARLAIALGIGGTEAFGQGVTRTDHFSIMGGTNNNMRGFGQFNQAYHAGRTGNAQDYTNFMGQILNGETAQPNGRQAQDFGKMLADAVTSGTVQNGQQLINWMQSSGLGGSNWQGVDDGWSRSPGLANQLVQMIRSSASGGGASMASAAPAQDTKYGYTRQPVARYVSAIENGERLAPEAAAAYKAMDEAARQAGVDLQAISGFRDIAHQTELWNNQVRRRGSPEAAAEFSAPPGYSNHHTGLAVDIGSGSRPDTLLQRSFDQTAEFKWLEQNAASFGFMMPYTQGNTNGAGYEPWEWKYTGGSQVNQIPGVSADNSARMGIDNARFTRDNARLDGSEAAINGMYNDRLANNEANYQNQVLQAQMSTDNTVRQFRQLYEDASRASQDAYIAGNRSFEDIFYESLPDTIDTEKRREILEHFRAREDEEQALIDEAKKYQDTMTANRIAAEQARAQIATGNLTPEQVQILQTEVIEPSGRSYMENQENFQNAQSRMAMFTSYQDDIFNEIMNNQVRAAEARALEFRAQSNALNAEFTREVTIRDMNRNGEGRDAIRAESDLKREEITLAFDQEIARLDEQLRFDPSLAESIEDTKEKLTQLNEVRLENLTNETEKLVEQWDKVKRERTFEIDGQLLDSIQGSRSVYGIGNDEGMNQALMDYEILGQQNAFEAQVEGLRAMGAEAGIASIEIEAMVETLRQANDIKIDGIKGQFNEWTEAINVTKQGTEGLFTDLLQGTKTVGESFRDFFSGILAGFAKIVAKRLTDGIFGGLMGTAGAGGQGTGGGFGGLFQGLMSVLKFSDGGVVPMQGGQYDGLRQGNNAIGEALRQEGPRSVLAALTPGERVLTVAEAQQYERFRPVLNFANGGVVPGMASTGVRAGSVGMSISVGDVNVTAGGGGGGVDGGAMLNAIREGVPALVQREIARQQGLGGRL
jgi:tape measure domain-containing protein